jgi:Ca2+-transporting ATPase
VSRRDDLPSSHGTPPEDLLETLDTDESGLDAPQVETRRERFGPNELERAADRSALSILVGQFANALIAVLVVAALLSVAVGNVVDAVLILVIVLADGGFGFVQDSRAERPIRALSKLAQPTVRVRRAGTEREIDATDLVPGDVILLDDNDATITAAIRRGRTVFDDIWTFVPTSCRRTSPTSCSCCSPPCWGI